MFGLSRQAYCRKQWSLKRRRNTAADVVKLVLSVRQQMSRIGTRKLYHILEPDLKPLGVGRARLFAIMRANRLDIKPLKHYHKTTDSYHRFHKHKDLVSKITPNRPEQVWVSDITYLGNRSKHTYLALVTDAYSKKIVGYDLSESLSADGCLRALQIALKQRKHKGEALIHHSDRGVQYCCDAYQKLLNKNKLTVSMTESYDPYTNAVAERVDGILKNEWTLEKYELDLIDKKKLVADSIEIYNTKRPH